MIKEFKEFAMRGNVVDLAVGVIIGVAFGKVVTSLVNDVIMPPIGKAMGGADFKDLFINLDPGKVNKAGTAVRSLVEAKEVGAAVIAYGAFLNTVIDFIVVAFCIFLVVKAMNHMKKKPVPVVLEPTNQEKLLTEIRDALRSRNV
ncbi:MAG: large conductance mechanosensitive channel protein MscL [Verrucomicrobiota bacterium]